MMRLTPPRLIPTGSSPRPPWLALLMLAFVTGRPAVAGDPKPHVQKARITILSTMLADTRGLGEWGFAALVEVDGERLLLDTGARPDTVLNNAKELGIELGTVSRVILTHHHGDHTGGLLNLRRTLMKDHPGALAEAHVGEGIFWPRPGPDGKERNETLEMKAAYEATGGKFVVVRQPTLLAPGVWLTGPVPRRHPERNWSGQGQVRTPAGLVEDTIPEDMSLVLDTDRGLVVVTGCGHAGVVNILEYARQAVRETSVPTVLGGLHLFNADEAALDWTAGELKKLGVGQLLGAHCTGVDTVYSLRDKLGLDRRSCVVGAVGAGLDLETGIRPGVIAR